MNKEFKPEDFEFNEVVWSSPVDSQAEGRFIRSNSPELKYEDIPPNLRINHFNS